MLAKFSVVAAGVVVGIGPKSNCWQKLLPTSCTNELYEYPSPEP